MQIQEGEVDIKKHYGRIDLCLFEFNTEYADSSNTQTYACYYHHGTLSRTYQREDNASKQSCYNLRYTDGAIEESKISTHVTVSLQGIGDKSERHGQHGCPCSTYHQEWNAQQPLSTGSKNIQRAKERYGGET